MTIAIAIENENNDLNVISMFDRNTFAKEMYSQEFNFSEVHQAVNHLWGGVWITCLDGIKVSAFAIG